jgi:predicted dehydrogenase
MRKAKELIDMGAIGRVILVEATHSMDKAIKRTPEMWQWYRKEMPGGPLCSFTVHHADNFNYLVGPVKKVAAFTAKVCGKAEADDVASAIVEFENGALGYLGGNSLTPTRQFIQIQGLEGVVFVDREGGAAYYQKKGTTVLVKQQVSLDWETQSNMACEEEMDEFAACIQGCGKPETGGEEGMAAWAIMEAIIRSAESGGAPVEIKTLL